MLVPRTMSTQHPDNAKMPFFVSGQVFNGEDEIREAYYAFELGCQEIMWDQEGKEVDPLVVEKLLGRYENFFRLNPLGEKVFLTPRIPNPMVEPIDGARLPQILTNIVYSSIVARVLYNDDIPPIFEVILPMTTSAEEMKRIGNYYQNFVVGQSSKKAFAEDTITIAQWLGKFRPEKINVIPLFEDKDSLLNAHRVVEDHLLGNKGLEYQRVFLARSDPALNYGFLAAVLLLNIALQRLDRLEKRIGIPIYPILGVGSVPFRGNLKPTNVESMLRGYPNVQTFTIQSAFKYDWAEDIVARAIQTINLAKRGDPLSVDEERSLPIIEKVVKAYQAQILEIESLVNRLATFVPPRRMRKLHIGLFGYSRNTGGVRLPRAITFCAALYSIGLPPEILGLYCLDSQDLNAIKEVYPWYNFEEDLREALAFYNPKAILLLSSKMREQLERALRIVEFKTNREHQEITNQIIDCFQRGRTDCLQGLIVEAGLIRRFLG